MGIVLAAMLLMSAGDPASNPVSSVEVRLPADADARVLGSLSNLITVRKGQPLSKRAVQRSIENLYATGKLANITVEVSDGADGPQVRFVLEPRASIDSLYFEGQQVFTASELTALTKLQVGNEYWPERAEAAAQRLVDAYRARGFTSVSVTRDASTQGLKVDLGFIIDEGAPLRVTSVTFAGAPGLPVRTLAEALAVRPGDIADRQALEAGVDALRQRFRRERYYQARVEAPQIDAEGHVTIAMSAGPQFDVVFSGNRRVSDTALKAVLNYAGDDALDEQVEQKLSRGLQRFYRFRGFHDATVRAEVFARSPRSSGLAFIIEEGPLIRVDPIQFTGQHALTAGQLTQWVAQTIENAAPLTPVDVHPMGDPMSVEGRTADIAFRELPQPEWQQILDEEALGAAVKVLRAQYRNRGYLAAQITLKPITIEGDRAHVAFDIDEGVQARVRAVRVSGAPAEFQVPASEDLKVGMPFVPDAVDLQRQRLARDLARKGYLYAQVDAEFTTQGPEVDCLFTVKPGPQVKVRRVLPVGNVRTVDEVLLSQATMSEGQVLDSEALYATQANLLGLGIFRSAQVEMLSPEIAEPLKTVLLKVKERPRISGEFGIGYFLAEGPRVVADVSAPNLGGRAVNLSGHGQVNFFALSAPALSGQVDVSDTLAYEQIGFRGNLSLQNRGLLPGNLGWRIDTVAERVFRPQFRFTRFSGVPSIDWAKGFELPWQSDIRPKVTAQLQYEIEWARVLRTATSITPESLSLVDQERLRFLFGTFALQTVRLTPTLDFRDNALSPHKGLLLQGAAEFTDALFSEDENRQPVPVEFIKMSALASGYVPLSPTVTLALSARGGRIFPLTPGSVTPPVKRFFLGGSTSMRGFNEDQLVAEDLRSQYRTEVRDCQVLASRDGCSSAAQTILTGKQVPSQGGELFMLLKAELRFPAFSVLDAALFFETGNLWLRAPSSLSFRSVAGAGLRYVTPIGPLALDVGFNLAPDTVINEPVFVVHFNIGVF